MFSKVFACIAIAIVSSVGWADVMNIECHDYDGKNVAEFSADFPGTVYLHKAPVPTTGVSFSKIQDGSYAKTVTITPKVLNFAYKSWKVQLDTDITDATSDINLAIWFRNEAGQPVASVHVEEVLAAAAPGMSASWIVPGDKMSGERMGYMSQYNVNGQGDYTRLICAIKP